MLHLHLLMLVIAVVALAGPPRTGTVRTSAMGSGPQPQASPAGMPAALTPDGRENSTATGGSWSNVAAVSLASLGGALVLRRRRRR
ncbi:MAG: LPXTG cell wall anchor domain-containing protein [Candidatus Eiseniibacteriota bacterium]